jgi:hypothetical protein
MLLLLIAGAGRVFNPSIRRLRQGRTNTIAVPTYTSNIQNVRALPHVSARLSHPQRVHTRNLKPAKYNTFVNRPQSPRGLGRGSAAVRLLWLRVRIPQGTRRFVTCACCVLSGAGLCIGLITRPEQREGVEARNNLQPLCVAGDSKSSGMCRWLYISPSFQKIAVT